MEKFHKIITILAIIIAIALFIVTLNSILTMDVPFVSSLTTIIMFIILGAGLLYMLRNTMNVFSLIAALGSSLVIGRLFSTIRLGSGTVEEVNAVDPLLFAETGPGIPIITYLSVAIFIVLVVNLFTTFWRSMHNQAIAGITGTPTINEWALTLLRIYVGYMFIGHFVGHIFAGPDVFQVYVDYFGSIGFSYPEFFVILAGLIELAVAIGLAFGFLTRLAALSSAIYLLTTIVVGGHLDVGYVWVLPNGGWEFSALWIVASLIFVIAGPGKISLDNIIVKILQKKYTSIKNLKP